MIRATFSDSGLSLGQDTTNLPYLYGLGDFFSMMFEDTSVVNLLLESSTLTASEVYSRFLQLTSTLSLEDVQTTTGSQVKLVLINSTDLVAGTQNEYTLPEPITSARYIANRPLVPTELLESEVDYVILQEDDGSCRIRFASKITDYAISSRLMPDGSKQYALWFVDTHLDERLISEYFGNLIALDPENSSERFANFVYGLYYVYVQGPTLSVLRKGLNLVLGIPLARLNETVIDIRTYLQTDQYIVVTDQNQYLVPYGLQPNVKVGDSLRIGDEIASWVEVKDYINDGDWWVNLYIPTSLVPTQPPGQNTRYATKGSELDFVMRNYLKTHSFLVNVNVTSFKHNQQFAQLFDVIKRAKPAYTQPIYVWTVKNEEVVPVGDVLTFGIDASWEEDVTGAYSHMRRNSTKPLSRGTSRFIRFNGPPSAALALGDDEYANSSANTHQDKAISGYANLAGVFRPNTQEESAWVNMLANRNSESWHRRRDQIAYRRGISVVDSSMTPETEPNTLLQDRVMLNQLFSIVPESSRVIPMTVMSKDELDIKLQNASLPPVPDSRGLFLVAGIVPNDAINVYEIDGAFPGTPVYKYYPALFKRDLALPRTMEVNAQLTRQFTPKRTDLTDSDIIIGSKITCDLIALYLVTQNSYLRSASLYSVEDSADKLALSVTSRPTRGMAHHGIPFYFSRANVALKRVYTESTDQPLDRTAQLHQFLGGIATNTNAKLVPLTVIHNDEFVEKCTVWGVQPPAPQEAYFVVGGLSRRRAVNAMAINTAGAAYVARPAMVGSRVSPYTGQVEPAYTLYPDFFRRDRELPSVDGTDLSTLDEYTPGVGDLTNDDRVVGFRLSNNSVALYWVSYATTTSSRRHWALQFTPTISLSWYSDGTMEALAKTVVAPYNTKPNPGLGYNSYDQAINDSPIGSPIDLEYAEFKYQDMYNTAMPVTRGSFVLQHRLG